MNGLFMGSWIMRTFWSSSWCRRGWANLTSHMLLLHRHITCPLIDQAEDLSPHMLYNSQSQAPACTASRWLGGLNLHHSSSLSLYACAGVIAAAVTLALYAVRRSRAH